MKKVILLPIEKDGTPKEFDLDHAQRILDHCRLNPPACWKLNDPSYKLVGGKITPVSSSTQ